MSFAAPVIGVVWAVCVASRAVRLERLPDVDVAAPNASTLHVRNLRDGVEVVGANAPWMPTEVIENQSCRDWATFFFEGEAVDVAMGMDGPSVLATMATDVAPALPAVHLLDAIGEGDHAPILPAH